MAAEEEERFLESQLLLQLEEQKESLSVVNEALAADSANPELLSVHEELVVAIRDAEEGLLHLKRSRLLREADTILSNHASHSTTQNDSSILDAPVEPLNPNKVEEEKQLEIKEFSVGSKCRFRYTDGRWYNGYVVAQEGDDSARISFLTPTTERMLMCKFFLQQRCRFGSNCRLSHGVDVPIASLKYYYPTVWHETVIGSSIWAISDSQNGIWREAELESWDDELQQARVVFRDDGRSAELRADFLSLSEYAQMTEEEDEDDSSSESSDSSYDENESENEHSNGGLGFLEATTSQHGVQTDTAIFAKWEHHTRGIASKMMANMGYREGMGLGASNQGIVDPILIKVLPPKQSLEHALKSGAVKENSMESRRKKRSRGGKRKREKKFAAAARAAKVEEAQQPDVFCFINKQLATQGVAQNGFGKKQKEERKHEKKEDRRSLIAYDDEVKELKNRVEKLEEMIVRNRKEKVVYEAVSRKLEETRKALADAESAHASATNAVVSKEKEKKWLKF